MSAQSLLEQLLKSGMSVLENKTVDTGPAAANRTDSGLGGFGTGAAAGGALALLLGSKGGRRIGGKALQYGGVAALGVMAFRAFNNWQAQQAQAPGPAVSVPSPPSLRTVNLLTSPEIEEHSRGMLKAMIAAAKADGHLDERERGLVEAELSRLEADPEMRLWFEEELRRPLDPAEVAQAAASPELAAEMYLASVLMVDDTSFMERAYLDELARQLKLSDTLKIELERQTRGG
jgi:uncharacterized membrane protein YebE (DUF533 family)